MTLTIDNYGKSSTGTGGASYLRLSGTIAEVVQGLADLGISAQKVVSYSESSGNAVALIGLKR